MLMGTVFDIGIGITSGVAAFFWFRSAAGKLPAMVAYYDAAPPTDPFFQAMQRSARMNRWGAAFSGLAAALSVLKLAFS
ncbi:hypothetical protein FZ983_16880 [Azospirillum sp. B21]|uniref:hypothetical protein n=1 Tax=Azospirillum sp. B21 TaxID=2607496 RepID=UPI0011EE4ED3|nr:hypothetical protein [Azospirillum sp. B21]KAA0578998.1 hypothetical protein FZ983_16880 [Azospirillum sp. B21]